MPPPTMPKHPNAMLGRHLGRKPPTDQQRRKTLPLRPFVKLAGRPVPPTDDYASKAQGALTKMMGNDREGCCVATALAKLLGIFNAYRPGGTLIVATDAEVSTFYHQVGGPGDNGLYSPDALNFARDRGFKIGGVLHKIAGFAAIDPTDSALLDAGFHWFGGLYYGVNLSSQQYNHAEDSDTWDTDNSGIVGGHAIPFTKRQPDGGTLATWARQPKATRRLMESTRWADEVYVVLAPEWFDATGMDTNHVNVDALTQALAAVAAGGTPDIPTDPNPPDPNPPGPNPPGPMPHEWSHTFSAFGKSLRIYAGYEITDAQMMRGQSISWGILPDLWALVKAIETKDWQAALTAAAKVLADLGIVLPFAKLEALARGLQAEYETRPMLQQGPPAEKNSVDSQTDNGYSNGSG
jgi:hypothetical protein